MARNSETQCLHGGNSKPKREKGGGLSQIYLRLPSLDPQLRDVQPDGPHSQGPCFWGGGFGLMHRLRGGRSGREGGGGGEGVLRMDFIGWKGLAHNCELLQV